MTTRTTEASADSHLNEQIIQVIDTFVNMLTIDKYSVELDIATDEQKRLYSSIVKHDDIGMACDLNKMRKQIVAPKLFLDLFTELNELKLINTYIATEGNKAYVWVVIDENEIELEDKLIELFSTLNSKYNNTGLSLDLTTFYESDNLVTPPAFHKIDFKES